MAETKNIGEMATLISDELLANFRWEKCKPQDVNWQCENDEHEKKTHPADVVFFYKDPYTNTKTYIHTDLKSFSESTLTNLELCPVLESLSMQVECAEISENWQSLFTESNSDFNVHGLLFVYNHDNKYIKSLTSKFKNLPSLNINTPKNSRLYVLDPNDIFWLNNISIHISKLIQKKTITEEYSFFYPQRKDQATSGTSISATIDLLKSPFIIIEDKKTNKVIIYYRPEGSEVDEFVYLIDYLRHHNLIEEGLDIHIYQLEQDALAPINFENAKRKCENILNIRDPKFLDLLNKITHKKINSFTTEFSELEIGMDIR